MFEGWKEGSKMPQGNLDHAGNDHIDEDEDATNLRDADHFEAVYNFRSD